MISEFGGLACSVLWRLRWRVLCEGGQENGRSRLAGEGAPISAQSEQYPGESVSPLARSPSYGGIPNILLRCSSRPPTAEPLTHS